MKIQRLWVFSQFCGAIFFGASAIFFGTFFSVGIPDHRRTRIQPMARCIEKLHVSQCCLVREKTPEGFFGESMSTP